LRFLFSRTLKKFYQWLPPFASATLGPLQSSSWLSVQLECTTPRIA
ncbi:hypothetical protein T12_3943, partial [Trichinella patagoniensis]